MTTIEQTLNSLIKQSQILEAQAIAAKAKVFVPAEVLINSKHCNFDFSVLTGEQHPAICGAPSKYIWYRYNWTNPKSVVLCEECYQRCPNKDWFHEIDSYWQAGYELARVTAEKAAIKAQIEELEMRKLLPFIALPATSRAILRD